jgi:UDP-N-acetylglucosamine acyltransferase
MDEPSSESGTVVTHPTAQVAERTPVGSGTSIGPGVIIEENVVIGRNCRLAAYAVLRAGTVLGNRVEVDSFSVIGGPPQDLHFDRSLVSGVRVGDGTVIRESVTISRSTLENGYTEIGRECLFMACSHAAHDCRIGDKVVLANGVMLAGHVQVGTHTFFGGGAGIHQFCRIGESVMLGGHGSISADVPPFLTVTDRNDAFGLNLVGLRRRGFTREAIRDLKLAYRFVYEEGRPTDRARLALEQGRFEADEAKCFLTFFLSGTRGFARPRRRKLGMYDDA